MKLRCSTTSSAASIPTHKHTPEHPRLRLLIPLKREISEEEYNTATASLESLQKTKADREVKADTIGEFIFRVQELDALTEFDEKLWLTTIETVTVHTDGRMTFRFKNGVEIAL